MTAGDEYRVKATELRARARREKSPVVQSELEHVALSYLRLAEEAERNSLLDISYEPPPSEQSNVQPQQQQQQQQQAGPKKEPEE
jgi:hypothetical protein